MKKVNIQNLVIIIIVTILFTICGYFIFTLLMQNIVYEKLGIQNSFTDHFIIKTQNVQSSSIDWQKEYPFKINEGYKVENLTKIEKLKRQYSSIVNSIKTRIDSYTIDRVPLKGSITKLVGRIDKLMGWEITRNMGKREVILLRNGYLAFAEPRINEEYIREIALSLSEFKNYLNEKSIDFLYANTGSKISPVDKQAFPWNLDCIDGTMNTDVLLSYIKDLGIPYIDFRQKLLETNTSWYDSYYKTDHHWKVETGLWAASIIVDRLSNDYKLIIDKQIYNTDNFIADTYKNFYLGCQGKIDAFRHSELEDFTLMLPTYETNLSIEIPELMLSATGDYSEVFIDSKLMNDVKEYSTNDYIVQPEAYYAVRTKNYALVHVKNHNVSNGKKIVVLYDSFSWYTASFLSLGVEEIDFIHLPVFTGSIKDYIAKSLPDMVLVVYSAFNTEPINMNSHTSAYDFR